MCEDCKGEEELLGKCAEDRREIMVTCIYFDTQLKLGFIHLKLRLGINFILLFFFEESFKKFLKFVLVWKKLCATD